MGEHTTSRRALLRTGLVGATAAIAGCSGGSQTPTDTEASFDGEVVAVGPGGNYRFDPGTDSPLHVEAGTTVKWVWESNGHNIVVGSQPDGADWGGTPGGDSKTYDEGYSYTHTFETTGTYHYWCQPHKSLGMVADLVVE